VPRPQVASIFHHQGGRGCGFTCDRTRHEDLLRTKDESNKTGYIPTPLARWEPTDFLTPTSGAQPCRIGRVYKVLQLLPHGLSAANPVRSLDLSLKALGTQRPNGSGPSGRQYPPKPAWDSLESGIFGPEP
jgi:hypothetical protein